MNIPQLADAGLSDTEQRLLEEYQRDFPVSEAPFQVIAERIGTSEAEVLASLRALQARGIVSRVGPVISPSTVGASTLAAMSVPAEDLSEVAELVSGYSEVNHNYEREHSINLWFVVTAENEFRVRQVLREIRGRSGYEVHNLTMLESYHIDLGFSLWC